MHCFALKAAMITRANGLNVAKVKDCCTDKDGKEDLFKN
jgi:hypothetical protein